MFGYGVGGMRRLGEVMRGGMDILGKFSKATLRKLGKCMGRVQGSGKFGRWWVWRQWITVEIIMGKLWTKFVEVGRRFVWMVMEVTSRRIVWKVMKVGRRGTWKVVEFWGKACVVVEIPQQLWRRVYAGHCWELVGLGELFGNEVGGMGLGQRGVRVLGEEVPRHGLDVGHFDGILATGVFCHHNSQHHLLL